MNALVRVVLGLGGLCSVALLWAQPLGAIQSPLQINELTGTVVDGVTGRPVAGVSVQVRSGSTTAGRSLLTDAAGRFKLQGLTTGAHFRVSHPDYLDGVFPEGEWGGPRIAPIGPKSAGSDHPDLASSRRPRTRDRRGG